MVLAVTLTSGGQAVPSPQHNASPRLLDVRDGKLRVVTVASGLFHPWSLAFLDERTLLVFERNGKLRIVRDSVLSPEVVWQSPTSTGIPGDMHHAVAVHPRFAQNSLVYVSYPKRGERGTTLAIARGRLSNAKLERIQEIFVADAWSNGGNIGGRILFGPDASLYVTVGDRDPLWGTNDNHLRMQAQDLTTHIGKTLRIRDDGSVPPDNPFVGRSDAKPEIFTYGHRVGYGLAFHPQTRELWQAEVGPMGGDEVNILQAGHNYGWPLVSTGRNYTDTPVSDQPWARPGMDNPRMQWAPSISPSSILFYTGDKFPRWKNNLFVGALTARQLIRIEFSDALQRTPEGLPLHSEVLLAPLDLRLRDIQQGPDGYIYLATEQSFPDTDNSARDGMVLRLEPGGR
jgi:glucose/arabinose dehydrogenase